jgi:hypothetical protein
MGGGGGQKGGGRETDLVEDGDGIGGDEVPELLQTRPGAARGGLPDGLAVLRGILSLVALLRDHEAGGVGPVVGKDRVGETQDAIREEAGSVLHAESEEVRL